MAKSSNSLIITTTTMLKEIIGELPIDRTCPVCHDYWCICDGKDKAKEPETK